MMPVILKWSALVLLNSAFSLYIALQQYTHFYDRVGIGLGIMAFVMLYVSIDVMLLEYQQTKMRKHLLISVLIKAATQLFPVIESLSGGISTVIIEEIVGEQIFFSAFFTTLVDGLILSIVAGVIFIFVRLAAHLITLRRNQKTLLSQTQS